VYFGRYRDDKIAILMPFPGFFRLDLASGLYFVYPGYQLNFVNKTSLAQSITWKYFLPFYRSIISSKGHVVLNWIWNGVVQVYVWNPVDLGGIGLKKVSQRLEVE